MNDSPKDKQEAAESLHEFAAHGEFYVCEPCGLFFLAKDDKPCDSCGNAVQRLGYEDPVPDFIYAGDHDLRVKDLLSMFRMAEPEDLSEYDDDLLKLQ